MQNPYRHLSDLPSVLPVFPLSGAPLFPRWHLPLNIFEPRYLNMIDDAMTSNRLIGMIQPLGGPRSQPLLADVGCVGRITSYTETDDGRYLITLTGIVRYRITAELDVKTPYRQVEPDFLPYEVDLWEQPETALPARAELEKALKVYTHTNGFDADWDAVEDAPLETLVHALAAGCPFSTMEKQALIEAADLSARYDTLIKLLTINSNSNDDSSENGPLQ